MTEFTTPDFLLNHSAEEVHEKMKSILPEDLDLSEGGHAFNMTMPTALVIAELCEFILPEVIQIIFPEWSYGEYLDGHAKGRGITRKAAAAASGEITITGAAGAVIPAGSLFSTASINDEPSVDYETTEAAEIPESGTITVPVQCTQTGVVGNAKENTIVLVSSKLDGITAVTNPEAVTGGAEEEDDDSLKERVSEYDKSQGDNFVGSPADYKRWATSVPGVGDATVIPAQDDSGMVTIVVTDQEGLPATQKLCTDVYNFIMRPDDDGERLANVNALLTVTPPATMAIGIKATVELKDGATIESVKTAFLAKLALYLPTALDEKEVKYTRVYAELSSTDGVNDFRDLQIRNVTGNTAYGTSNIPITTSQLPTVAAEDLTLTSGTV